MCWDARIHNFCLCLLKLRRAAVQHPPAQAAFHVFGMELLCRLDLHHTNAFFATFFRLPGFYWRGFLGSNLSSAQLLAFAMLTFAIAPAGIKSRLVTHLLTDPAGSYLVRAYLGETSALLRYCLLRCIGGLLVKERMRRLCSAPGLKPGNVPPQRDLQQAPAAAPATISTIQN